MKAAYNQNFLDLAIVTTGVAETAFGIACDNGISITSNIAPGMDYITNRGIENRNVVNYFKINQQPCSTPVVADSNIR